MTDTAPESALTLAVKALRAGRSLSFSIIRRLCEDGHDITGLIRSIRPDTSSLVELVPSQGRFGMSA